MKKTYYIVIETITGSVATELLGSPAAALCKKQELSEMSSSGLTHWEIVAIELLENEEID